MSLVEELRRRLRREQIRRWQQQQRAELWKHRALEARRKR